MHFNTPGVLVYLSSVSPKRSPTSTAFKVLSVNMCFCTLFLIWCSLITDGVVNIYNIKPQCISHVRGKFRSFLNENKLNSITDMYQFSMFLDVLADMPLPLVWLFLYYVAVFILHMIPSVISITSVVNSICQASSSIAKNRTRTCGVTCILLGTLSMLLLTEGAMLYQPFFTRSVSFVALVTNVGALMFIIFIYGIKTLKHDFLFVYKSALVPWFWLSVTLLPVLSLVTMLFYNYHYFV